MVRKMNDKKLDALLLLASGVLTEEKSNEFLEYTGKIVKIPSSLRRKIIALNNNESRKRELSQTEKYSDGLLLQYWFSVQYHFLQL